MEPKSISSRSAFADFNILYAHLNDDLRYSPDEVDRAYFKIKKLYGLDGMELKLILHLAHILPNVLLCGKVAEILKLDDDNQEIFIVCNLQRENFVRIGVSPSGERSITLTKDAINAFNRYEPLGTGLEIDLIEVLRNTTPAQMITFWWIRRFKAQMLSFYSRGWNTIKASDLSDRETSALCIALRHFILHFTEPLTLKNSDILSAIPADKIEATKGDFAALVQKGYAVTMGDGYVIAPKVAEALLQGHDEIVNYEEISNLAQVIKSCDIEKKELFFSPESQEEIKHLHFMLSKEGFDHACKVLRKKKRNPAIQSLLWGGPGTGKTETVKQIALETGRDIFLFDVAKVTASDWGATENLYRKLFGSYRYIVAVKKLTPILFINEADQVLSHRLSELDRSIDKAENTVSTILLQELEDMHGILLATTNFADLLDEAFDRRFLFKTELQKPDARARKSIWKSMIPELSEEEAEFLAKEYVMSGAQINNVATKRDLAELYFLGDRGLSYIEQLCCKELSTEKRNPANKHIGF